MKNGIEIFLWPSGYAGEDAEAKKIVSDLIVRVGFAPIDLGGVNEGRQLQFPGGALSIVNLVKYD